MMLLQWTVVSLFTYFLESIMNFNDLALLPRLYWWPHTDTHFILSIYVIRFALQTSASCFAFFYFGKRPKQFAVPKLDLYAKKKKLQNCKTFFGRMINQGEKNFVFLFSYHTLPYNNQKSEKLACTAVNCSTT